MLKATLTDRLTKYQWSLTLPSSSLSASITHTSKLLYDWGYCTDKTVYSLFKGLLYRVYNISQASFRMGNTASSGSTNRTDRADDTMMEKEVGTGSGSTRWLKFYPRTRRQSKTEKKPSKAAVLPRGRALRKSHQTAGTISNSFSASFSNAFTAPTSPCLIETSPFLVTARLKPQTKASYQIKKHKYEELGCMHFHFDSLQDAVEHSRTTHRPVLLVQAEIPGDTDAGSDIFSHPLIVEASDSLFITVFNNDEDYSCGASRSASGKSRRTRVGFLDESGNEIVQCLCADMLTRAGMANAMISALEACHHPVPKYLLLLQDEEMGRFELGPVGLPVPCHHRVVFGLDDSALGEVEFAGLEGVISTRAGFLARQKVVEVFYDSGRLCFGSLILYALKRKVGDIIYYQTNDERIAALMEIARVKESSRVIQFLGAIQLEFDPKPALRRSPLRYVPLTELQATRANRLVHLGRFDEAMHLLSPRQGLIFMQARRQTAQKSLKDVVDVPILPAWMSLCDQQVESHGVFKPNAVEIEIEIISETEVVSD